MVKEFIKLVYMNLKKIADSRYAYLEQVEDGKFRNAMLGAAMGASLLGGMASCDDPLEDEGVKTEQTDNQNGDNQGSAQEGTVHPVAVNVDGQNYKIKTTNSSYRENAKTLGKALYDRSPRTIDCTKDPSTECAVSWKVNNKNDQWVVNAGATGTTEELINEVANELGIEIEYIR